MKATMSMDGATDATEKVSSTNTAQLLITALAASLDPGRSIQGALVTVETNDIRFAFGVAPTTAGMGHILTAGQSIMLRGGQSVRKFQFVSKTADSAGVVHITVYYEA